MKVSARSPSTGALLKASKTRAIMWWSEAIDTVINGPLLLWQRVYWTLRPKPAGERWLYSLDFHTAVVADIAQEFTRHRVKVLSNVISFHNRHSRRIFKRADPVAGVNARNWRKFTEADQAEFQKRHARLFSRFDGFLVSYPTSFVDLYTDFGKPILVVNPIRYEHPFSNRLNEWESLDRKLKSGISSGLIHFVANNAADAEYAAHYLEAAIPTVPSICRYTKASWNPTIDLGLTHAHYTTFAQEFESDSGGQWKALRGELGKVFSWNRLLKYRELFYVPYAPSTMFLFELATAGMPVAVPSLELLKTLRSEHPGVFGQLTFHEMSRRTPPAHRTWLANMHWRTDDYLEWWYQRSDFADKELMPNVRIVESLEQLVSEPSVPKLIGVANYRRRISERNELLVNQFDSSYSTFLARL